MRAVLFIGGALAAAMFWLVALAASLRAIRALESLDDLPIPQRSWPRVSLVRPACNEAERLEGATHAALAMDYPDLQVVLVDDRSTDATPEIVDRLAADPRVVALHVSELPAGWLGKLNALQHGVQHADGEWLLFADADSHFAAGALRRAIDWADEHEVDFVSVIPGVERAGFLADAAFSAANGFFAAAVRPWRILQDDKTVAATGAFMLVRREMFERTPGFEWLRLEVSDDFGLCLMVKRHGGRAGLLIAPKSVRLTWYANLREMVVLMQKNFFAISGRFSLGRCLLQAVALVGLSVAPFLPLFVLENGWALPSALAAIGLGAFNGLLVGQWTGRPLASAALPWVGLLVTAFIVARAGIVGARQGGITWRGVLYRSDELRDAQRVRL